MAMHPPEWEKIFANKTTDKQLLSKVYKQLLQLNICLLRNLYAGQKATVRTGHGIIDCFQIGKGVIKALYCHLVYLIYMQNNNEKQ